MSASASRWLLLVRSLLVQGSFNYRTLIGSGLAWVLLPVTEEAEEGRDELVTRAAGQPFNAHPYLSTVAVGALARAAEDGAPPDRLHRFREALRSPLGSLGDKLVWSVWRPVCLLGAGLAALAGLSASWVIGGLLIIYNVLHAGLRSWGLRIGLDSGLGVGRVLARARLPRKAERLELVGVLLAGLLLGALSSRAPDLPAAGWPWVLAGGAALALGLAGGATSRRWVPGILSIIVAVGFVLGGSLLQ